MTTAAVIVVADHPIDAVRFANETARRPVAWRGCLLDLMGRAHEVRDQKKGTAAWSPVVYTRGAERGKRGVTHATALVLDFDHVSAAIHADVFQVVEKAGWAYAAASSYSHRAQGDDDHCFRLALFLSRPTLRAEYPPVWSAVVDQLGGVADPATRDISRIWYVASCPVARTDVAWVRHADGAAIDVDRILQSVVDVRGQGPEAFEVPNGDDPAAGAIPEGSRHAFLVSLAGAMRRRGADADAVAAALESVNATRCKPPLRGEDVARLASAICRYDPASLILAANATDMGNAERFAAFQGHKFRYVHAWGTWLSYDGRRWVRDGDGAAIRAARDTVRMIAAMATSMPQGDARKFLEKHAYTSECASRLSAMLTLAQALLPLGVDALDRDLKVVNCLNGTVDLATGKLRPHDRNDLLTHLVHTRFDPEATCPRWESFLDRALGANKALIDFVQRAVGYSLTGHTDEHVLFLLYGTGANGKSTFIETVRSVLGDYATVADFTTFIRRDKDGARNDLARLVGARLVSAVEADAGAHLAESLVKQVTGGDTITARFLFREFFDYKPHFKVWLAANHKPRVSGTDHGIWRRIRMVPFTVTIPEGERDPKLPARLLEELPGILAWAVRGCRSWQTDGLGLPDAVRIATSTYRDEMDEFGGFLDAACVAEPNATTSSKDLFAAYQTWCATSGERERTKKALGIRLGEQGFQSDKGTGGVRVWTGVRLRRTDEPVQSEWRVAHGGASFGISPNINVCARAHESTSDATSALNSDTPISGEYPELTSPRATRHSLPPAAEGWEEGDL